MNKKSLLCKIGIHDRAVIVAVRCRMWKSILGVMTSQNVDGVAKIKRCKYCESISAWLSDGRDEQKMNLDDALLMIPSLKTAYEEVKECT
jgi:hypothetical protein